MKEQQNGYSICFNEWALDKTIKNELGLLLIISSLCAEKGYCYANNDYLSDLFEEPTQTISRKIKILEEKGYITTDYKKNGCTIISREIRLTKMLTAINKNDNRTINKNVKENNINSLNNINNNKRNIKEKEKEYKDEFEKLWNMYPNKKGKTDALKDYIKAREDNVTYDKILNGLNNYISYINYNKTQKRYIKNGSTWFHKHSWEDDYEIEKSYLDELEEEWKKEGLI